MQSGNIFVAMEYLPYGALSKYTTSALLEISIKEIAEDTLQGLKVMHKEGFTHRDIKPEVGNLEHLDCANISRISLWFKKDQNLPAGG